jgi:hypothetical protein
LLSVLPAQAAPRHASSGLQHGSSSTLAVRVAWVVLWHGRRQPAAWLLLHARAGRRVGRQDCWGAGPRMHVVVRQPARGWPARQKRQREREQAASPSPGPGSSAALARPLRAALDGSAESSSDWRQRQGRTCQCGGRCCAGAARPQQQAGQQARLAARRSTMHRGAILACCAPGWRAGLPCAMRDPRRQGARGSGRSGSGQEQAVAGQQRHAGACAPRIGRSETAGGNAAGGEHATRAPSPAGCAEAAAACRGQRPARPPAGRPRGGLLGPRSPRHPAARRPRPPVRARRAALAPSPACRAAAGPSAAPPTAPLLARAPARPGPAGRPAAPASHIPAVGGCVLRRIRGQDPLAGLRAGHPWFRSMSRNIVESGGGGRGTGQPLMRPRAGVHSGQMKSFSHTDRLPRKTRIA